MGFSAALAFALAPMRRGHPFWQAGGVLYIGVPALALVATRALALQGAWLIIGLFLAVWATDTGALVFGKLIGGKKIAPRLSPGKTWAGRYMVTTLAGRTSCSSQYRA